MKLEQINPKTNTCPPNPHAQIKTLELHLVGQLVCIPQRPNRRRGHCFLVDGRRSDDEVINSPPPPPPPLQLPTLGNKNGDERGKNEPDHYRSPLNEQSQNGSHTHFTWWWPDNGRTEDTRLENNLSQQVRLWYLHTSNLLHPEPIQRLRMSIDTNTRFQPSSKSVIV